MANNQENQCLASREVAIRLFAKAVGMCVAYPKQRSVRDSYRQLEWTVLQQGDYFDLPSESTFRRVITRERLRRHESLPGTSRSTTLTEVEAILTRELVAGHRRHRS